jgi:hypothetical protein
MGKGLMVNITNNLKDDLITEVIAEKCVYNIDRLNNLNIQPNQSSSEIYVEAKASGSCAFESSFFTLHFKNASKLIGSIGMEEKDKKWSVQNYSFNITQILNEGSQYVLDITVSSDT